MEGDRLGNFKLVTSNEHPEKAISAKLKQQEDGSMWLVLRNLFQRHFKVRMGMMPFDHENRLKTSICPVRAGLLGIERWPHPIFQVWLGDFRLLDDSSNMTCTE